MADGKGLPRLNPPVPWLPGDYETAAHVVRTLFAQVDLSEKCVFHPVIMEFQALIEHDPVVRMTMTAMIDQIPARYKEHHPKTVNQLLTQLNAVLTMAPAYVPPGSTRQAVALVGTPFSAILIWTMGTPAGFAVYRDEKINAMFRKLLAVWGRYLDSEASTSVLNPSATGWQCAEAQEQLEMEDYQYAPEAPHWGFASWNQFFTRKLKPGARPVQSPKDATAIVAACDSKVYRIARGVQRQEKFWIKAQPYSLVDLLDHRHVEDFVGGDVFQAFLNPFNYHHWHSPVSGTVREAFVKEGLYFSQTPSEGEDWTDQDHSEGYIAHVQTRAIIFIEADNPAIGLICVVPIGMVEISSCIIDGRIKPGARVEKGQELGYFQFGGSTHCVLFRKGVVKAFTGQENSLYRVGQVIAHAHEGTHLP
jgi:phosphatidylserine decarboxylase